MFVFNWIFVFSVGNFPSTGLVFCTRTLILNNSLTVVLEMRVKFSHCRICMDGYDTDNLFAFTSFIRYETSSV